MNALPGINFTEEILPSPSVLPGTEQHIPQTSKGEQVIGHDEILQVHDIRPRSQRFKSGKNIKPKHARHT